MQSQALAHNSPEPYFSVSYSDILGNGILRDGGFPLAAAILSSNSLASPPQKIPT